MYCVYRESDSSLLSRKYYSVNKVKVATHRGVGRILKAGGFHDPPAKLRGRGYATCACAYYLDKSGVTAGEPEKL